MKNVMDRILFDAVTHNKYYTAKFALEHGANPNIRIGKYNITPLMNLNNDNLPLAKLLVKYNADIHAISENGFTALLASAYSGHIKIFNYLIKLGADFNYNNKDGWSAAHFAARNGYINILMSLIKKSANLYKPDNLGITPLAIAIVYKQDKIKDILLKYTA